MRYGRIAAIALAAAASLAACTSAPPTGSDEQAIRAGSLPDLPGCAEVRSWWPAGLSARPIADVADLYVVFDGRVPLCIDSREDIAQKFGRGVDYASSNPMPGTDPTLPASSNPMPGVDPGYANSNPMPGVDPGNSNSNPMPGQGSSNPR